MITILLLAHMPLGSEWREIVNVPSCCEQSTISQSKYLKIEIISLFYLLLANLKFFTYFRILVNIIALALFGNEACPRS